MQFKTILPMFLGSLCLVLNFQVFAQNLTGPSSVCAGEEVTYYFEHGKGGSSCKCGIHWQFFQNGVEVTNQIIVPSLLGYNNSEFQGYMTVKWGHTDKGEVRVKGRGCCFMTWGPGFNCFLCEDSNASLAVEIGPSSSPISGNSTGCSGTSNTYSVNPIANVSNVSWTAPPGWSVSSPPPFFQAQITPTNTSTPQTGIIRFYASNSCGTTEQTKQVTFYPSAITLQSINGQGGDALYTSDPTISVCPAMGMWFSAVATTPATQYEWIYTLNGITQTSSASQLTLNTPTQVGAGFNVKLRVKGQCSANWSNQLSYNYITRDCSGGGGSNQFTIAPNPVEGDSFEVSPDEDKNKDKSKEKELKYDIILYNQYNERIISFENVKNKKSIDTKSLQSGLYFMQIIFDDKIINKTIWIRK